MSESPSIYQYKKNIEAGTFKAYKCNDCGAVIAPPLGACYSCGGTKMSWTDVSGRGTLVSFTVIHVAPEEFASEAPYYVAVVKLDEGPNITARLTGFDPSRPQDVKVGMPLRMTYVTAQSGKKYLAFGPA
ncbi:MAG: Zn-ribbon domain-containing OB-fold protein [Candidatus Thorarchaeota archaeon]